MPILSYVWTVINVGKAGASDHASRKQPFGPDLNRNISTCGIASILHLGRECVLFWVQGVESEYRYRYRTSGYRYRYRRRGEGPTVGVREGRLERYCAWKPRLSARARHVVCARHHGRGCILGVIATDCALKRCTQSNSHFSCTLCHVCRPTAGI